jgi:predicted PurR-regulated permease PerM
VPGIRASIVIAAVLFLLDFLVFAGLLIPVFAAYVVLWGLPQALAAWRRPAARKAWLIRSVAYGCAGVVMTGVLMLNRALVVQGADESVAAIEQFHAKEGRYPNALEETVPRYLPRVPQGNVIPWVMPYRYWQDGAAAYFSYTPPPWPVQRIYNFQTRQWRIND